MLTQTTMAEFVPCSSTRIRKCTVRSHKLFFNNLKILLNIGFKHIRPHRLRRRRRVLVRQEVRPVVTRRPAIHPAVRIAAIRRIMRAGRVRMGQGGGVQSNFLNYDLIMILWKPYWHMNFRHVRICCHPLFDPESPALNRMSGARSALMPRISARDCSREMAQRG